MVIFSDTNNQLQQEVEERTGNIALLTDADNQLNFQIQSLYNEFQNLTTTIESMASSIESLKSADNVLTSNQKDNALRFHVETKLDYNCPQNTLITYETKLTGDKWEENTLITYHYKLTDTHNAMDIKSGYFTAPFSGNYGFVFYATFKCGSEDVRELFVEKNGTKIKLFFCQTDDDTDISKSSSVYFALSLKKGEGIVLNAGTTYSRLDLHPAKFTGFLLQKD